MGIFNSTEIESKSVHRISSGIHEFDYLYGSTGSCWGLPTSKITLLTGESGVGKTRLLVELVKHMVLDGDNIIFMQGEVGVESFVSEKMNGQSWPNLYLTDDITLEEQVRHIIQYAPSLMIIDSAQQLELWKRGRNAKEIVNRYRSAIEAVCTHIILISQMNANGSTKGGTEISHMVDICLYAKKSKGLASNQFILESGKNRYGISGIQTIWEHNDEGVHCISHGRFKDQKYLSSKPLDDVVPLAVEVQSYLEANPIKIREEKGFWRRVWG